MADGRQLIEETYRVTMDVYDGLADQKATYQKATYQKATYTEEALAELEGAMASCVKWAKLCRGKVWLRTGEGAALAEGCLASARELEANLGQPGPAIEAALTLSGQLEALAKIIATKSQVIT